MDRYIIEGGNRLSGEIKIHGAKNAVLPILAGALITGESLIHNCPKLTDVDAACNILKYLGCNVDIQGEDISIVPQAINCCDIPDSLMREMRSSVVFLGAIIARCGRAKISMPGGCELGARPIDLHLSALEKLGVTITEYNGYLECTVNDRLKGTNIHLPFPSVGATENIILAACLAEGETVLHNPAREPEIDDLAAFLNAAGAKITIGEKGIHICGVKKLGKAEHSIIPDRIEAATYLCCVAAAGGEVLLRGIENSHMTAMLPVFEEFGCEIKTEKGMALIKSIKRPESVKFIRTMPYPGFPTDAQSPFMAVSCIADGTSMYVENIFESRYKHAAELARMGAKIKIEGRVAVVEGVKELQGASVVCTDLRGGAALVVAALAAKGSSEISNICHIERGYQHLEAELAGIGARIKKLS